MDYKEQIEQAKHAAVKWREQHPIVGVGELRVDCMVDDLCRSITDLLARAEASEARVRELETRFRTEKCENGPECAELGRVRKALAEAEARAEKAEREVERLKGIMRSEGIMVIPSKYPGCKSEWNLSKRGRKEE